MTAREEAAALRLGLMSGYISISQIKAWADQLILEDRASELPVLLDLSLLGHGAVPEAVSLLGAIPGECSPPRVGRCAARSVYQGLKAGKLSTERAARALYTIMIEGYAPDQNFEAIAYSCDDGVDLALQGTYGTLQEIREQMLTYLERYAVEDC